MNFDILEMNVKHVQGVDTVILKIRPQPIDGVMQAFAIDYVVPGTPTAAQIESWKGKGKTISLALAG